jgi:DNA-binding response OmpR family regulator
MVKIYKKFKESEKEEVDKKSKGLVLIIEDDADSRDVLSMVMENFGYEVLALATGKDFLQKIAGKPIQLALLDIMMPQISGFEVLQQLRESKEFARVPVFMVTARTADDDMLSGYKYGADYYIQKPFSSRQIEYGIKMFLKEKDSANQPTRSTIILEPE